MFYLYNLNILHYFSFFVDPATATMEGILEFHDFVFFFLVLIFFFCIIIFINLFYFFWVIVRNVTAIISLNFRKDLLLHRNINHNKQLEVIWTLAPCFILSCILFPSISLLYAMDEVFDPALTMKVLASQWYWSYEYSNIFLNKTYNVFFDSYMLGLSDLNPGNMRLLEVDNFAVLPTSFSIRVIVTSNDVLHCWAIPAFGIKIDAVPGRLNQVLLMIDRVGVFYGQCSELCGVNHGFMPICIRAVEVSDFLSWIINDKKGLELGASSFYFLLDIILKEILSSYFFSNFDFFFFFFYKNCFNFNVNYFYFGKKKNSIKNFHVLNEIKDYNFLINNHYLFLNFLNKKVKSINLSYKSNIHFEVNFRLLGLKKKYNFKKNYFFDNFYSNLTILNFYKNKRYVNFFNNNLFFFQKENNKFLIERVLNLKYNRFFFFEDSLFFNFFYKNLDFYKLYLNNLKLSRNFFFKALKNNTSFFYKNYISFLVNSSLLKFSYFRNLNTKSRYNFYNNFFSYRLNVNNISLSYFFFFNKTQSFKEIFFSGKIFNVFNKKFDKLDVKKFINLRDSIVKSKKNIKYIKKKKKNLLKQRNFYLRSKLRKKIKRLKGGNGKSLGKIFEKDPLKHFYIKSFVKNFIRGKFKTNFKGVQNPFSKNFGFYIGNNGNFSNLRVDDEEKLEKVNIRNNFFFNKIFRFKNENKNFKKINLKFANSSDSLRDFNFENKKSLNFFKFNFNFLLKGKKSYNVRNYLGKTLVDNDFFDILKKKKILYNKAFLNIFERKKIDNVKQVNPKRSKFLKKTLNYFVDDNTFSENQDLISDHLYNINNVRKYDLKNAKDYYFNNDSDFFFKNLNVSQNSSNFIDREEQNSYLSSSIFEDNNLKKKNLKFNNLFENIQKNKFFISNFFKNRSFLGVKKNVKDKNLKIFNRSFLLDNFKNRKLFLDKEEKIKNLKKKNYLNFFLNDKVLNIRSKLFLKKKFNFLNNFLVDKRRFGIKNYNLNFLEEENRGNKYFGKFFNKSNNIGKNNKQYKLNGNNFIKSLNNFKEEDSMYNLQNNPIFPGNVKSFLNLSEDNSIRENIFDLKIKKNRVFFLKNNRKIFKGESSFWGLLPKFKYFFYNFYFDIFFFKDSEKAIKVNLFHSYRNFKFFFFFLEKLDNLEKNNFFNFGQRQSLRITKDLALLFFSSNILKLKRSKAYKLKLYRRQFFSKLFISNFFFQKGLYFKNNLVKKNFFLNRNFFLFFNNFSEKNIKFINNVLNYKIININKYFFFLKKKDIIEKTKYLKIFFFYNNNFLNFKNNFCKILINYSYNNNKNINKNKIYFFFYKCYFFKFKFFSQFYFFKNFYGLNKILNLNIDTFFIFKFFFFFINKKFIINNIKIKYNFYKIFFNFKYKRILKSNFNYLKNLKFSKKFKLNLNLYYNKGFRFKFFNKKFINKIVFDYLKIYFFTFFFLRNSEANLSNSFFNFNFYKNLKLREKYSSIFFKNRNKNLYYLLFFFEKLKEILFLNKSNKIFNLDNNNNFFNFFFKNFEHNYHLFYLRDQSFLEGNKFWSIYNFRNVIFDKIFFSEKVKLKRYYFNKNFFFKYNFKKFLNIFKKINYRFSFFSFSFLILEYYRIKFFRLKLYLKYLILDFFKNSNKNFEFHDFFFFLIKLKLKLIFMKLLIILIF